MTEIETFLKPILAGNFDTAGAFADWLEEHDDKRGVLLRRRWKRWRSERQREQDALAAKEAAARRPLEDMVEQFRRQGGTVDASVKVSFSREKVDAIDNAFCGYIRDKFPESWPPLSEDA